MRPIPSSTRYGGRFAAVAAGAAALLAAAALAPAHAAGPGRPPGQTVPYQGHRFTVPADWQVVDLAEDPTACVRFDRHALYLGAPRDGRDCPARSVGRTEAMLVQPAAATAADPGSTDSAADGEITTVADGVRVTSAYGTDPAAVLRILAGAGLPTQPPAARSLTPHAVASLPPSVTDFQGKGFESCSAPSSSAMSAWRANSPYGAIGVYFGGQKRGCAQPNLSASWVAQQAAAGWHMLPIWVGLQAEALSSPTSQGTTAADDAIAAAKSFGFSPGSVLYYDMEGGYSSSYTSAVLSFVSAWTAELHANGWLSGLYSSSTAAVAQVAAKSGSTYGEPDVLWSANWNGAADTVDSVIPAGNWAAHQRVHQYAGQVSETHGGVTLAIDRDFLDVGAAGSMAGLSQVGDLTGDGVPDLVAIQRSTGDLLRYSGPDFGGATRVQIGTGWNVYQNLVGIGDVTGDHIGDLLALTASGDLYRYSGPGFTGSSRVMVGNAWNTMSNITPVGDLTGDGIADVIAIEKSTGKLFRYAGPDFGGATRVQIGTSWNTYHTLAGVGDQNGDGVADILATGADGDLYRYSGPGFGGSSKVQVGTNWDTMTRLVSPGNLAGGGNPDLLTVEIASGDLYRYLGPDFAGGTRVLTGTGW